MSDENKTISLIEKMKLKVKSQEKYGGKTELTIAKVDVTDCPNCGAGRAMQDGLTHCGYCRFEFTSVTITDGLHLKKEDNSRK